MKKILPVTVVENRGRYEVHLAGRLIRIRTRAGTWMLARFETRAAAEAYRWALIGSGVRDRPPSSRGRLLVPVEAPKATGKKE